MWEKQAKKSYFEVSKEAIWKILSDVEGWYQWNLDIESCTLKDGFKEGGAFEIKLKNLPSVTLLIEKIIPNSTLVNCANLLGAKMNITYELREIESGIEVSTTIAISGINSKMWVALIGEKFALKALTQMDNLLSKVKNNELYF